MTAGADPKAAQLEAFFSPRCVAVIGASTEPGKLGNTVLRSSAELGFGGHMFGVNPRHEGSVISGWPIVASLDQIGEQVDLAFVGVPARSTPTAVAACASAGVRACVLVASGLGELGGPAGAMEQEMGRLAADAAMRLLGPNGFGLYVGAVGLNLTAWPAIPAGRVALLTQSGNVAIALFEQARRAGIGFSSCAGLGNQVDVGFSDLLAYHARSAACDVVALYVEGLTPGSGRALHKALLACRVAEKPVVVLKAGRREESAAAVTSHTGALSGDDRIWDTVLGATGATRAGSSEEMVDVLAAASKTRPTRARAVVLTDGGGDSVLALDALGAAGIPLAELGEATRAALDALTPPAAPRVAGRNPVTLDTAGGLEEDPALLARCAAACAEDPGVDVVVVSGGFGGYASRRESEMAAVDGLVAITERGTPVLVHSAFSAGGDEPVRLLRARGVPVYPTVERLARALASVSLRAPLVPAGATAVVAPGAPATRLEDPATGDRAGWAGSARVMATEDTASILRSFGIVVPSLRLVSDREALAAVAAEIGFPVCLKVEDPGISHKSEVGGVRLGLGPGELGEAADDLSDRFPKARLLVMAMLDPGFELLVGASQDPTFGPTVVVGRGGTSAELDPDVAVLLAPLTKEEAVAAWASLRCSPLLSGYRGSPGVDLDALAGLAVSMSQLAEAMSPPAGSRAQLTVECNPVLAYAQGYAIADMRGVEVT
ncbi:MAG: acetate--CoA ligase family protein [Acidimicrobiales bacterium]